MGARPDRADPRTRPARRLNRRIVDRDDAGAFDDRAAGWGTLEGDAATYPQPRMFALERMRDVRLEDDAYRVDPSLELDDALRHSFGVTVSTAEPRDIVVRFGPSVAAFVPCRRWPAEISRERTADGCMRLVEPADARAELRKRAEAIVAVSDD